MACKAGENDRTQSTVQVAAVISTVPTTLAVAPTVVPKSHVTCSTRLQAWADVRNKFLEQVPLLLENFHQYYLRTSMVGLNCPDTNAERSLVAQQQKSDAAAMDTLKKMLRDGVPYERILWLLPKNAEESYLATYQSFVSYAFLEVFHSPPPEAASQVVEPRQVDWIDKDEEISPTQFWSSQHLAEINRRVLPDKKDDDQSDIACSGLSSTLLCDTWCGHADPLIAMAKVAREIGVPLEHLIVPTPPDGMCLYHCFGVYSIGVSTWQVARDDNGWCTDAIIDKIHTRLARKLRTRLVKFFIELGRPSDAKRLCLPGAPGYPGGDELPYLVDLMHCKVVEHSLQYSTQPSMEHIGGAEGVMHIGHTRTRQGGAHWVFLRDQWPDVENDE